MTANERDSRVAVVHGCMLFRRRRFYIKRLLLGAFASEAARQLANDRVSRASQLIKSHDQPGCARAPECIELRMHARTDADVRAGRAAKWPIVSSIIFRVK